MGINKNRRIGKDSEKAIANLFNGKRVGILGEEDVSTEKFSIEVKCRKKFVGSKWMQQAIKNNKNEKIPLVIIHEKNKEHLRDYVLISLKDFLDLINFNIFL